MAKKKTPATPAKPAGKPTPKEGAGAKPKATGTKSGEPKGSAKVAKAGGKKPAGGN